MFHETENVYSMVTRQACELARHLAELDPRIQKVEIIKALVAEPIMLIFTFSPSPLDMNHGLLSLINLSNLSKKEKFDSGFLQQKLIDMGVRIRGRIHFLSGRSIGYPKSTVDVWEKIKSGST